MPLSAVQQLDDTGVVAGSYTNVNLTVNSAGRIVSITSGSTGIPPGTVMSFYQAAAPTGWTQVTVAGLNDATIRLVTGPGGGTGGSVAFSTLFSSSSTYSGSINITSGTVGGTTLTSDQLGGHTHRVGAVDGQGAGTPGYCNIEYLANFPTPCDLGVTSSGAGSATSHTHTLVGSLASGNFTSNFAVKYANFIIASKN
jgi:hypothetical protein